MHLLSDPPSRLFGLEDPPQGWVPLYDPTIPEDQRGPLFGQWLASYFTHKGLHSHDPAQLTYREGNSKMTNMSFEELMSVVDLGAGDRGDTVIGDPALRLLLVDLVRKSLMSPEVREAWGAKFWYIWGDENAWNIPFTVWGIEDQLKEANDPRLDISWKVMHGANHFVSVANPVTAWVSS